MPVPGQRVVNGKLEYWDGQKWVQTGADPSQAQGEQFTQESNKGAFSSLISQPQKQLPQIFGGVTTGQIPKPLHGTPIPGGGLTPETYIQQEKEKAENIQGESLAKQITARRLEMLRQMLSGGQSRGIQDLRRQLAQRGMMDSGSLGGGVTDIVGQTQGRLAEGTQAALMGESETLLDLLKGQQQRNFSREQLMKQLEAQMQMAKMQQQFQKSQQPNQL